MGVDHMRSISTGVAIRVSGGMVLGVMLGMVLIIAAAAI
jgi:hypothetical protein